MESVVSPAPSGRLSVGQEEIFASGKPAVRKTAGFRVCRIDDPVLYDLHLPDATNYRSSLKYDSPKEAGGRCSRFLRRLTVMSTTTVTTYGSISNRGRLCRLTLV